MKNEIYHKFFSTINFILTINIMDKLFEWCMNQNNYEEYENIFGETNDFTRWLYNVLSYNSYVIVYIKNMNEYGIINLNNPLDLDLTSCNYKTAYKHLDGVFSMPRKLSFEIKDVKYPNKPIYKIPFIKALYYSYKHEF